MTLTFSNSHLWAYCAASVSPNPAPFERDETPSEEQQEGTAAAWVADSVLRGTAASAEEFAGETAPNGWPIDATMIHHVQTYVEIIRRHGRVGSETELSLWNGMVRGRVDQHAHDSPSGALRVWEFKYGYRIVEPEDNPQLILAAGALVQPHHNLITLAVQQPRPHHPAGPYRKWVITRADLQLELEKLYRAAIRTMDKHPLAIPGHHCAKAYCPRANSCPALATNLYAAYTLMGDTRRGGKLTPAELGAELKFLKMAESLLKARKSACEAEATGRIKNSETIPGWMLEAAEGDRVFTVPAAMIQAMTGLDPYEAPKLKTPAKLEGEGAAPQTVALLTTKPFTGMRLKPFSPPKGL